MVKRFTDSFNDGTTFIDKCLAGAYINVERELDDQIRVWTALETTCSLQEHLGMTEGEFDEFMSTPIDKQAACFKSILLNRLVFDN